jgi:PAS domain S-box-containing protein
MEQNLNVETLKQKVIDLERKLKEYEGRGSQQDIQEVTKRLEKIAEMGDDGIIVFGEDYRIEFANTVASELTGYLKEKLVGMDFRRLLSERDIGYLDQMHSEVETDESKRVCTDAERSEMGCGSLHHYCEDGEGRGKDLCLFKGYH